MTVERRPIVDRFEEKFIPEPNSGCWLWTGAMSGGYGTFYCDDGDLRRVKSSRAAWMIYRGQIPDDKWVLHHCDNSACVNPDHLYLGDHEMNVTDRTRRDRNNPPHGSANGSAKLRESDIPLILADGRSHETIAKDYGVNQSQITRIKQHKAWTHVD